MSMLPCLASVPDDQLLSIVNLDRKQVSNQEVFDGRFHVTVIRWSIASKVPGGPVYAMVRVEFYSPIIRKVIFGHLTLAKLVWHADWDLADMSPTRQDALAKIGTKLTALINDLPLSSVGPRSPLSSFLWLPDFARMWEKDAILLNFHHPLYNRLHNLRAELSQLLPSARVLDRGSFHISIDGVVEFQFAVLNSQYAGGPSTGWCGFSDTLRNQDVTALTSGWGGLGSR